MTENSRATEERVEHPAETRREQAEVREPEPVAAEPAKYSDNWWVDEPVEAEPVEHSDKWWVDELVEAEPAKHSDKWWVDEPVEAEPVEDNDPSGINEGETTIAGPSFLGLSSTESGEGGYSYLFQEEEEPSHKAGWVLLVVLLVLGGVLYAKWQPIRDYVLTPGSSHSRPQQPAQANHATEPGPDTRATQAGDTQAPTTTPGSSDAQTPLITPENTVDQKKAAEPKTGDAKQGLAERNKGSADNSNAGAKAAGKQAEKQQTAVKEEKPAAGEEKPAAAKRGLAEQVNEGGGLVSTGEKYLYGRGVTRSCGQAMSYFNAAAAKQDPQAFSHLGALYAAGQCVPMDRAVAYSWFRRAYVKEPGNHYFERNLTMLWREMTPAERQRATGRR